jgi:predicted thioesterase
MTELAPRAELRIGLEGRFEREVVFAYTTAAFDPKLPEIFSTPAMIAMMEAATSYAVEPALPPGKITVGTRIEVDHIKSAGIGTLVTSTARLAEINGRFLIFEVESRDDNEILGRGRITRAIIDLARIQQKLKQSPSR